MLQSYIDATEPFLVASKMLGGENYCTGSSVIPCLDEIKTKLKELENKSSEGPTRSYIKNLQKFMCSEIAPKRFKSDLYKSTAPYNVLTALDPRFTFCSLAVLKISLIFRYNDLYYDEDQYSGMEEVLMRYPIYREEGRNLEEEPQVSQNTAPPEVTSSGSKRR